MVDAMIARRVALVAALIAVPVLAWAQFNRFQPVIGTPIATPPTSCTPFFITTTGTGGFSITTTGSGGFSITCL